MDNKTSEELTFNEALEKMKEGVKITHHYFSADEWMIYDKGKILFEDGFRLSIAEFHYYRSSESWLTGYSIWKNN